jgi:uncharacterized 2Fe-2S/4Fe-4S cluster protein (DUF4445 family)
LVDTVAGLVSKGIITDSGRIITPEEADNLEDGLKKRLIKTDERNSFLIEKRENCNSEGDIILTQRDVRELQNAKAAIAAGINILVLITGFIFLPAGKILKLVFPDGMFR